MASFSSGADTRPVTYAEAVARYRTVPLVPWAPGARDQFVTISTELAQAGGADHQDARRAGFVSAQRTARYGGLL